MQNFKKLISIISLVDFKRLSYLSIMMIIGGLLDMFGVASILPFVAILTEPTLIQTNNILNIMFQALGIFGIKNDQQFLLVFGAFVFILICTSLIFKIILTYFQSQTILMIECNISKFLVENYLYQSYVWFLSRNSSDLGKTILSEVSIVVNSAVAPLLELISKSITTIVIIILLIIVDPKVAIIAGLSFLCIYILIFYFVSRYMSRIGVKQLTNNRLRFKVVSEAFGAIKEVKFGGLEHSYAKSFSNSANAFSLNRLLESVARQLPRYILEAFSFLGILLLIFYLIDKKSSFNNSLPIISLYIFAGYRLMPAFQQIYSSLVQLAFAGPSIDNLHNELKNTQLIRKNKDKGILPFNKKITLKNVYYNYPNTSRMTLKDINLIIPQKFNVGFIGPTGCGKTTTIDIISGLLEAKKGTLEVDGKVITKENLRSWQRCIGYVPQYIYLSDTTVQANIAFGVNPKKINQNIVEKVSKIANLHKFVVNELPKKYQTIIGERGVRLSGGQRQRIGIARALYNNPKLLILDEATNALDDQTERAVLDAVKNLGKSITIIMIAHRLNTLKNCDIIFKFCHGRLISKRIFKNEKNI
jgi:ABC-type multidrug transport system fused ATPase/permease subunit